MKKKLTAALAAGLMVLPFGTVSLTANATPQNVLLGDANADGNVNISDAIYTLRYLLGRETPTAYQITAMDVNQNRVIENNDIFKIQQIEAGTITAETVYKELYTVPDNSSKAYRRHNCSNTNLASYSEYTISQANILSSFSESEELLSELMVRGAIISDISNIPTVRILIPKTGGGYDIHSGFVIGSNTIATAASNIYDKQTNSFCSNNVIVQIYAEYGTVLMLSTTADYLHIPSAYASSDATDEDNYGLIHVNTDISAYKTDVGVAVNEFMVTASNVTVSGYDSDGNRKLSTGSVINNYTNGLMKVETASTSTMVGGQAYIPSVNTQSAIGVIESYDSTNGITDVVRLTPTLLRFYKYNSYLTE